MKTIKIYEGSKTVHEIELCNIVYFMANGKCTKVFLMNDTYIHSTKILKHYHEQLHEKEGFFRVHRKYLINMIHIVGIVDESRTLDKASAVPLPILDNLNSNYLLQ